ncbi:NUDIX domain-containing protein [Fictibacillus sp. b24]|uniref:NUDIX domain-containing protein n=1 Tax=Fictibacillus sp. b24 TaxID=3055863 RepID=UPI0025A20CC6|nr:NUDIX domain-containing protein [Fictibacillus sp. b24]MDM5315982.1 NUDIX domain-containing protein [Fictibacillus sp. b24]
MEFGDKIPDVTYRERDAVYAVVLDEEKKTAIIIQNGKGFLPGGGLKLGEEHITCLKRECIEETGYSFHVSQWVGEAKQYFISSRGEYIMNNGYFYTGSFGDYVKMPVEKDHELVWMEFDKAEKILFHSSHAWAVKKAISKDRERA